MGQVLLVVAAAVLLVAGGWAVGRLSAQGTAHPEEGSAEAGFARDMQVHHQQTVEMSLLLRDRTQDPEIRRLAYDVARTQQQQAGQMYGWLSVWGLPGASPEPAMAWMEQSAGHGSSHEHSANAPVMPGMATPTQLDALADAHGRDAERLYLELMIPHHQAGVTMAEAVAHETEDPVVRPLAESVLTTQQTEIRHLEQLLAAR